MPGFHLPIQAADRLLVERQGTVFSLRGLNAADSEQHLAHLLRLSPESRYSRFQRAMGDAALQSYSDGIDWHSTMAFGVFEGEVLRGMAELFPFEDGSGGEVAISIEEAYQHFGLGRLLVLALQLMARRMGMRSLRLVYQNENDGMKSLLDAMGASAQWGPDGAMAVLSIPPAQG